MGGIVSRIFDTGATESGYGLMLDGSSGIYFGIHDVESELRLLVGAQHADAE